MWHDNVDLLAYHDLDGRSDSAPLRSIAGKPVRPPAPQLCLAALAQEEAAPARLATGRGAAAVSASYRGPRRR